jgi:hypothetical protein
MLRSGHTLLALLVVLVLPATALAIPLVSVDTDPSTGGVQSSLDFEVGDSFEVDILIEDVDDLNGFQFTLEYDANVVTALDVTGGGFLPEPNLVLDATLGLVTVSYSEVALFGATNSGSGVLATIGFEALELGTSGLVLLVSSDLAETLILSAPFGQPICGSPGSPDCLTSNGSISVIEARQPGGVVPEPSGAALFAAGTLVVGLRLRRSR